MQELARDPVPPCLSSPLVNLQFLVVDINKFDEKEIAVLGGLLQSTPALKIMDFVLPLVFFSSYFIHNSSNLNGELYILMR